MLQEGATQIFPTTTKSCIENNLIFCEGTAYCEFVYEPIALLLMNLLDG